MANQVEQESHPWKGSSARSVLQQLIMSGEIPATGMTPKSIWETFCLGRPEFVGFRYKNFPSRLRSMRAQVEDVEEPQAWIGSSARLVLEQLIMSGEIPATGMTPKAVWETFCLGRPEFEGFRYKNFPSRLRSMRAQIEANSQRSARENAAFVRDQEFFPVSAVTNRGKPRWQGSAAERLLKADIAEMLNDRMTPAALQRTREEYRPFDSDVFRKHIHQEVRLRKYIAQYHGPPA